MVISGYYSCQQTEHINSFTHRHGHPIKLAIYSVILLLFMSEISNPMHTF